MKVFVTDTYQYQFPVIRSNHPWWIQLADFRQFFPQKIRKTFHMLKHAFRHSSWLFKPSSISHSSFHKEIGNKWSLSNVRVEEISSKCAAWKANSSSPKGLQQFSFVTQKSERFVHYQHLKTVSFVIQNCSEHWNSSDLRDYGKENKRFSFLERLARSEPLRLFGYTPRWRMWEGLFLILWNIGTIRCFGYTPS